MLVLGATGRIERLAVEEAIRQAMPCVHWCVHVV